MKLDLVHFFGIGHQKSLFDNGSVENHVFLTPRGTKCPKKLGASGSSKATSSGQSKSREGVR
jgi:hypothetical protein